MRLWEYVFECLFMIFNAGCVKVRMFGKDKVWGHGKISGYVVY